MDLPANRAVAPRGEREDRRHRRPDLLNINQMKNGPFPQSHLGRYFGGRGRPRRIAAASTAAKRHHARPWEAHFWQVSERCTSRQVIAARSISARLGKKAIAPPDFDGGLLSFFSRYFRKIGPNAAKQRFFSLLRPLLARNALLQFNRGRRQGSRSMHRFLATRRCTSKILLKGIRHVGFKPPRR